MQNKVDNNEPVHYNSSLSPTTLKTSGLGECGTMGTITCYPGMVDCPVCALIAQHDTNLLEDYNNKRRKT